MDINTVIKGCAEGNAKSQRMLFDLFAPKMLTVCIRYTKNRMEAEDILQEGFIKLFEKVDTFSFQGSFEGWIKRIFINTALDHIRKEAKNRKNVDVDNEFLNLESNAFILENIEADGLLKIINELPSGYKTVFNLFAIEGFSHKEIADLLKINENTSKSQYSRAKLFIQKKLEEANVTRF